MPQPPSYVKKLPPLVFSAVTVAQPLHLKVRVYDFSCPTRIAAGFWPPDWGRIVRDRIPIPPHSFVELEQTCIAICAPPTDRTEHDPRLALSVLHRSEFINV